MAKVPVGCWRYEGDKVVTATGRDCIFELLEELCVVCSISIGATTITGPGILPVEINTIVAILGEESKQVINKLFSVGLASNHCRENTLPSSGVIEGPSSKSNHDLELGVPLLQITDNLI